VWRTPTRQPQDRTLLKVLALAGPAVSIDPLTDALWLDATDQLATIG
jgi:hypothetical protein